MVDVQDSGSWVILQMTRALRREGKKKGSAETAKPLKLSGAGGRNRTDTPLRARDFESRASTNFTTPAKCSGIIAKAPPPVKEENRPVRATKTAEKKH